MKTDEDRSREEMLDDEDREDTTLFPPALLRRWRREMNGSGPDGAGLEFKD